MKPVKTIQEQIEILKSRKITIRNERFACSVLEYENYYSVINGYKDPFIASTNNGDIYKDGTEFNEIVALYTFDRKLREILLPELLRIEHSIKSQIVTVFSQYHGYDHSSYLRPESFNTNEFINFRRFNELIINIFRLIDKQKTKHSAVNHYMNKYKFVPLWVLTKVMTFGLINSFYSCMRHEEKEIVAKAFKMDSAKFKTIIDFLALFRNKCAHGERIYCFRKDQEIARHPAEIPNLHCHEILNIPKNKKGYKYGTRDVLALLIAMKFFMHPNRYKALLKHIDYALHKKLAYRLKTIEISSIENAMGLNEAWYILKSID